MEKLRGLYEEFILLGLSERGVSFDNFVKVPDYYRNKAGRTEAQVKRSNKVISKLDMRKIDN